MYCLSNAVYRQKTFLRRKLSVSLLAVDGKKVPRTEAKRKDFSLAAAGDYYLQRIIDV